MGPRHMLVCAALLLLSSPAWAEDAAIDAAASGTESVGESQSVASSDAFNEFARSGSVDFEAGRFENALALFERALAYPASPGDRAIVRFNMGACLLHLERFSEAEQAFAESARLDAEQQTPGWLMAGRAAVQGGAIERAEEYLGRLGSVSPEWSDSAAELREAIRSAKEEQLRQQRSQRYERLAREGAQALAAQHFEEAKEKLTQALEFVVDQPAKDRASIHYGLAVAYYRLGSWAPAGQQIDQAIAQTPDDAELYTLKSRISLRQKDYEDAKQAARRAIELGHPAGLLSDVDEELEALSPLPRTGWSGMLVAMGGWDTNPLQSGVGIDSAVASGGSAEGSPTVSALGRLALTGRTGERSAMGVYYDLDLMLLLGDATRNLSLQSHEVGARWYRQLGERVLFSLTGAGAVALLGTTSPSLMSYEGDARAKLELDPLEPSSTRFEIDAAMVKGDAEYSYLTGARLRATLAENWSGSWGSVEVRSGVRYVGIGRLSFLVAAEEFPACESLGCVGREYRVPLGYWAPNADVDLEFQLTDAWKLGGGVGGEYRRYSSESMIAGERTSRKLRADLRWRLGARSALGLDEANHWELVAEYNWLGSASNVAYDATDPEHYLDYGDRSFGQHLVEGGVSAQF